jgi:branched-chain amino acid aminotransferase
MIEYTGSHYFTGDTFYETSVFREGIPEAGDLYEVLRVKNGVCLFAADHLLRLMDSVKLSGHKNHPDPVLIHTMIVGLIQRNQLVSGNIKLVYRVKSSPPVLSGYCIPFSYPHREEYSLGVKTSLYNVVRINPNVKMLNPDIRNRIRTFIAENHIFEALLVNNNEEILEGSQSNLFFISTGVVWTAPDALILKGITRQKVIQLCAGHGIPFIEKTVSIRELDRVSAVFITGTSPKLLPVQQIGSRTFRVDDPVMRKLMQLYDNLLDTEIARGNIIFNS